MAVKRTPNRWLWAGLGLAAAGVLGGVYASLPPSTPKAGRWYRVSVRPQNPLNNPEDSLRALGFMDVLVARIDPRDRTRIEAIALAGPAAGRPTSIARIEWFADLLDPRGEPSRSAIMDADMPRDLGEAYSYALAYELDLVRLGAMADYALASYPIARAFVVAKRDALRKVAEAATAQSARALSPPKTSGVSGVSVGFSIPILSDIASGIGDVATSVVDRVGSSPVFKGASGLVQDFARSDLGKTALRALGTVTFLEAAVVGVPVLLASAAFAIPGILRGEDFASAYADEVGWRLQETATIVTADQAKEVSTALGDEASKAIAKGGDEFNKFLDAHPDLKNKLDAYAKQFTDDVSKGTTGLAGILRAANLDPAAITADAKARVRAWAAREFGEPADLRRVAERLGVSQEAAAHALDLVTGNQTLSTIKGRTFDPFTHADLSPFTTKPPEPPRTATFQGKTFVIPSNQARSAVAKFVASTIVTRDLIDRYRKLAALRARGIVVA